MLAQQKQEIVALFQAALAPLVAGTDLTPNVVLERPRDPSHGDIACNIAMQLAKPLKTNPRELATRLVAALLADPARGLVESAEIAGPGFINLRLAAGAKQSVVRSILQQGAGYGRGNGGARPPRDHRIRLGQPDRPAARRPRPPGRAGRRPVGAVRSAGPRGHPRVLLQRRRRADRHAGQLGAGARPRLQAGRRRVARVGLQRRLHRRHRRRLPGQEDRVRPATASRPPPAAT
jgi:hypothetical protein